MLARNRIAIMQPYFLPYIGYWQLMNCVDYFIVYDDIEFTKRGWIHRNRYLSEGKEKLFTLPLRKDSDYLDVFERSLSGSWYKEREKLCRKLKEAYLKSPFFYEVYPVIERCIYFESYNLFDYIFNSIREIGKILELKAEILVSSEIGCTREQKGKARVLKICELMRATQYINPIGGRDLYHKDEFSAHGVELLFHKVNAFAYKQAEFSFMPNLSIIDVLMFNGITKTKKILDNFQLH